MQRIDLGLGQAGQGDQCGQYQSVLNLHGFSSKKSVGAIELLNAHQGRR
jgi:hypothetical protein